MKVGHAYIVEYYQAIKKYPAAFCYVNGIYHAEKSESRGE